MSEQNELCFIIMPIGKKKTRSNIFFKKVYNKIKNFIESSDIGFECTRADDVIRCGNIKRDILEPLRDAKVVIADMTDKNFNVAYELGIRHSFRKMGTILITSEDQEDELPFDLRGYRTISYPSDIENDDEWNCFLIDLKNKISKKVSRKKDSDNPVHDFLGENIGILGVDAVRLNEHNELKKSLKKAQQIIDDGNYGDLDYENEQLKKQVERLWKIVNDLRRRKI